MTIKETKEIANESNLPSGHGYQELLRLVEQMERPPGIAAFEALNFREMTRIYFKVLIKKISAKTRSIFFRLIPR